MGVFEEEIFKASWYLVGTLINILFTEKKKKSASQCRTHGFDPWSGEVSHAWEQQSPCTTTIEPVL